MINKYVKPVLSSSVNYSKAIALYENENHVINVGFPGIAPYKPIYGNMFGFNTAIENGYFYEASEYEIMSGVPVYAIGIDEDNLVLQFIQPANRAAEERPCFSRSEVSTFVSDRNWVELGKIKKRAL